MRTSTDICSKTNRRETLRDCTVFRWIHGGNRCHFRLSSTAFLRDMMLLRSRRRGCFHSVGQCRCFRCGDFRRGRFLCHHCR